MSQEKNEEARLGAQRIKELVGALVLELHGRQLNDQQLLIALCDVIPLAVGQYIDEALERRFPKLIEVGMHGESQTPVTVSTPEHFRELFGYPVQALAEPARPFRPVSVGYEPTEETDES